MENLSFDKKLGAQPCKSTGTAPGDQQKGEISHDTGCPGDQDGGADLPDIVKHRAQDADSPQEFFGNYPAQEKHSGQTEQTAGQTVKQRHQVSAKDRTQNDAGQD